MGARHLLAHPTIFISTETLSEMSPELEKCARNLLVCEKSSFRNEKSRYDIHVSQHYFNYKVSVLIPECAVLPATVAGLMDSFGPYYRVRDLPVYKLLEENFLENVLKRGNFYALSYKTRIDEDNTVAFLPTGQLILSVDKDTYERLGLEGKPSQYNHRQVMRYVVTVDVTEKSMAPGSKRYQRVLASLTERVPMKCDFLFSRHKNAAAAAEDGALKALLSQFKYDTHKPILKTHTLKDMLHPSLKSSDLRGDGPLFSPHHFLEWLGAVNLDITCSDPVDSFLSIYNCPEPHTPMSQGMLCTLTGLLLPEDLHSLLQELRNYFDEPKFSSWLAMTVHGFVDSPVAWGTTEHGFLKGGENFYTIVVLNNQDYWLHMATGSHDGCPP
ncbi:ribonuclease P protein subunit p40 isoform X1 [Denticeps clupeoides]|uniref:Uncharacterized protein n=1 Tax=Denticeps clupeoides TaxID=299321 RepID=A0AAY4AJR8_9TELE|nr:ribonuclease P protein subunit p40 isoform X1 [Denticeps clupeoides]